MNAKNVNKTTEEEEDQHILDTYNSNKREKKMESKSFKNLRSSIAFIPSSTSKKKLEKKLKQIDSSVNKNIKENTKSNTKKVKFNKNITIIDVECWKQYNLEQTADEHEDIEEEEEEDDKKKKKEKKKKKNDKRINDKNNNIACTCLII